MSDRKRVLLIEDHDDSRHALTKILRHAQFHVTAYEACEPAEPHLEAYDMDIALLDVNMPGRCGDDFGKELRERCPRTMIVFITAAAILGQLKDKVPDCFVLHKPVDAKVLIELIECFNSSAGYSSPMKKMMDGQAGPANM